MRFHSKHTLICNYLYQKGATDPSLLFFFFFYSLKTALPVMKQSVFEHLATNATNQGAQAEQFKSEVMFTRLGPFILFKYNPYNIYKYTDIYIYIYR